MPSENHRVRRASGFGGVVFVLRIALRRGRAWLHPGRIAAGESGRARGRTARTTAVLAVGMCLAVSGCASSAGQPLTSRTGTSRTDRTGAAPVEAQTSIATAVGQPITMSAIPSSTPPPGTGFRSVPAGSRCVQHRLTVIVYRPRWGQWRRCVAVGARIRLVMRPISEPWTNVGAWPRGVVRLDHWTVDSSRTLRAWVVAARPGRAVISATASTLPDAPELSWNLTVRVVRR